MDVCIAGLATGLYTTVSRQVPYVLQDKFKCHDKAVRAITYVADFVLEYSDGHIEIIDVKGMATNEALMKRKLFQYKYPLETLIWISYSKQDGGWIDFYQLQKLRRERKKIKTVKEK